MTEEIMDIWEKKGIREAVGFITRKKLSNEINQSDYEGYLRLFSLAKEQSIASRRSNFTSQESRNSEPAFQHGDDNNCFHGRLYEPRTSNESYISTHGSSTIESATHPDAPQGQSQKARLWKLLLDGLWHDTNEIQEKVYGKEHLGTANIKARIHEIRETLKEKGGTYEIVTEHEAGSLWKYKLQRVL